MHEIIERVAIEMGLEPKLILAIATVETNCNAAACRYEPEWRYYFETVVWAKRLGQTFLTEKIQQATSWGAMQVMGSVARELGFDGYLTELSNPEPGIRFGCMKFKKLLRRYPKFEDAIASYNAGSARLKRDLTYVNQEYVDKVLAQYKKL